MGRCMAAENCFTLICVETSCQESQTIRTEKMSMKAKRITWKNGFRDSGMRSMKKLRPKWEFSRKPKEMPAKAARIIR